MKYLEMVSLVKLGLETVVRLWGSSRLW